MTVAELPRPPRSSPLPRRDPVARAHLGEVARRARPLLPAGEQVLAVDGPLGVLLPGGGLRRGSTVALDGAPGAGATTVALHLAAAATTTGEWAAAVDPEGLFGGLAAAEAGVALDRFAVVRWVPPARWATAVAALLDGVALVVATTPPHLRAGDARQLVARARERGTVLVALGPWSVEAVLRLHADGGSWPDLAARGALEGREVVVHVEHKGATTRGAGVTPRRHAMRYDSNLLGVMEVG